MSRFVAVAQQQDLQPGKMMCVTVEDRRILLVNAHGEWFASDDTCTHEDASLATGSLKECYVKCPLHGSRFDLRTGEAMDEPAEEPLRIYAVRLEEGQVLVDLS